MTALKFFTDSIQKSLQNLASLLLRKICLRGYALG
jgi:hypothetical protein